MQVKKYIPNIQIVTTYSVIQRKFVWIVKVPVKDNGDHLVSHGVKRVSSPYLNTNMMTVVISHIPNENNIRLTDKDQSKGPGIARMSKCN